MINILIHITMLLVLSFAEGFRLTEFFTLLTGSVGAGAASAAVSVIVILYLALFNMRGASIFATVVCIFLSLASFLKPYENLQVSNVKTNQESVEKPLPIPQWEPRKFRGDAKEDYRKSFNAELKRVERYNERLEKLVSVSEAKELRYSEIVVFVLGALVLGFCVPILTYTVSHKLADDIKKRRSGFHTGPGVEKISEIVNETLRLAERDGLLVKNPPDAVATLLERAREKAGIPEREYFKMDLHKTREGKLFSNLENNHPGLGGRSTEFMGDVTIGSSLEVPGSASIEPKKEFKPGPWKQKFPPRSAIPYSEGHKSV